MHFKSISTLQLCCIRILRKFWLKDSVCLGVLDPVVQSPISANPGLTVNKTYGVNPGLALIGL